MAPLSIALTVLVIATALGAATVGGVFFAFSTFVMRALGERPPAEGKAAMVAVNRVILGSAFMPVFFGTAVLALALAIYGGVVRSGASGWLLSGALAYLAGSIWVTIAFNVPRNVALGRADGADEEAVWKDYLVRWTRWNHVRTIACLASAVLFIVALVA